MLRLIAAPLALALAASPGPAQPALAKLKPGHPRLFADAAAFAAVKARADRSPAIGALRAKLRADAAGFETGPFVKRDLSEGQMLEEARLALKRVATLALLWRIDGDAKARDRAKAEMAAIADLPDWDPRHFLDTAELIMAMAVGYDWLYDELTPEERARFAGAIAEKGLAAGLKAYDHGDFWVTARHNWGLVCNGGLIVGALAVGDTHPAIAQAALDEARRGYLRAAERFGPDGGWDEGPGYWRYGVNYAVFGVAALESALGTDLGLFGPGLQKAADFGLHVAGPTGKAFNFADASDHGLDRDPAMFWLARRLKKPVWAAGEWPRAAAKPDPFHLLWAGDVTMKKWPATDARFRGAEIVTFRSAWDQPRALYLGAKGGDNAANHSHLDLGSFVLDAAGVRWALDLGPDNYGLPGYFLGYVDGKRYGYYRLGTSGHNTLTIDGKNQATTAVAPIVAYSSKPAEAGATIDLTAAYPGAVTRAARRFVVKDRKAVLIEDGLDLLRPADVVWHFHTKAKIQLAGSSATLVQDGERLEARILAPAGAVFAVRPAGADRPQPGEASQPDVQDLVVAGRMSGRTRIAVELTPAGPLR